MHRILVIGGESHLGVAIGAAHARRGDHVTLTTRRLAPAPRKLFLDLGSLPERWTPPAQTTVAYLCAGITSIAQCEQQPKDTARINVHGTTQVCRILSRAGVFIVFFSTNLVFDGEIPGVNINAPTCPRCEYGRQKSAVEAALQSEDIPALVVRLTKVIQPSHDLLNAWSLALKRGEPIAPFSDMPMAPISLQSAVDASIAVADRKFRGIIHVSARRDITYLEAARHLALRLGVAEELIRPRSARDSLPSNGFIPRHTTLAASANAPIRFAPPEPLAAIDSYIAGVEPVAPCLIP